MMRVNDVNRRVAQARVSNDSNWLTESDCRPQTCVQMDAFGLTSRAVVNIIGPIAFGMCNCIPVANPIANPIAYDVPMGMFG